MSSPFISRRAQKVPKSGIREMFNIAQRLKDIIDLSLGEPDFRTPSYSVSREKLEEALERIIESIKEIDDL